MTKITDFWTGYGQGYRAARYTTEPIESCPLAPGTEGASGWRKGFRDGQDDNGRDEQINRAEGV